MKLGGSLIGPVDGDKQIIIPPPCRTNESENIDETPIIFLSILLTFNACVEKQSTQDDAQQLDMSSPDMQSTDQGTSQGGMEAMLGGETAGELAGEQAGEQAGEVQAGETAGESIPTPPRYRELIQEATGELIGEEGAVGAAVILVTAEHTEVLGLGLREIDGAPVDAQTVFQIGSVSKPITGLILASLIEAPNALIRADDPVNDHLSDLSVPSGQDGPITLEQLATHYSALPNFPNNLIGPNTSPGQGYTRELLNDFLSGHTLDNEPGTSYIYSNLGYGLLGLSLSDALNTSGYEQLLLDEFIKPLSLERTGLKRSAFLDQVGDNISEGYGGANGRTEVGIAEMGVLAVQVRFSLQLRIWPSFYGSCAA